MKLLNIRESLSQRDSPKLWYLLGHSQYPKWYTFHMYTLYNKSGQLRWAVYVRKQYTVSSGGLPKCRAFSLQLYHQYVSPSLI
jgi:hypothetical protein